MFTLEMRDIITIDLNQFHLILTIFTFYTICIRSYQVINQTTQRTGHKTKTINKSQFTGLCYINFIFFTIFILLFLFYIITIFIFKTYFNRYSETDIFLCIFTDTIESFESNSSASSFIMM